MVDEHSVGDILYLIVGHYSWAGSELTLRYHDEERNPTRALDDYATSKEAAEELFGKLVAQKKIHETGAGHSTPPPTPRPHIPELPRRSSS